MIEVSKQTPFFASWDQEPRVLNLYVIADTLHILVSYQRSLKNDGNTLRKFNSQERRWVYFVQVGMHVIALQVGTDTTSAA